MTTNEESGQDRRRRRLPWLLLGCLGLTLLLLGDVIGWTITRNDLRGQGIVAGGKRLLPPRSVTGAAGGPILQMGHGQDVAVAIGRDLAVTARVIGTLAPGRSRPLVVTVRNGGSAALRLTGLHVAVQPGDRRCLAGWFAVTGDVPSGTTVAAGASTEVTLRLELRDEPVNQNACKAQHVPFRISVDAVRTST